MNEGPFKGAVKSEEVDVREENVTMNITQEGHMRSQVGILKGKSGIKM